jgi:hypothetical protein
MVNVVVIAVMVDCNIGLIFAFFYLFCFSELQVSVK